MDKSKVLKRVGLTLIVSLACLGVFAIYGLFLVSQEENAHDKQAEVAQEQEGEGLDCKRGSPFPIPAELLRSVDLIKRRYDDKHQEYIRWKRENGKEELDFSLWSFYSGQIASVRNCLNISYEDLENDLDGHFTYDSSTTPEELTIKVSSRYRDKDELVIGILLSHEIYHAIAFQGDHQRLLPGYPRKQTSDECLSEEAAAFAKQVEYYWFLNEKEQDLLDRELKQSGSQQVSDLYELIDVALTDKDWEELPLRANKAIEEWVRNDPGYIKQCNENAA